MANLSEFFAGLTWPLRGRKVVKDVEKRIQDELHALRWQELHAVRSEAAEMRSSLTHQLDSVRQAREDDRSQLTRQLDIVRQMREDHFQIQQNYLQALEKLIRGNLSHLHDRISTLQVSENATKKDVSTALDQIANLQKSEAIKR